MIVKWRITLVVAVLWAGIEYFTQIGSLEHMPFLWWLFFGIVMWFGFFWFVDAGDSPQKSENEPRVNWKQVVIKWALRFYIWLPLIVIGYFLSKYIDLMLTLRFLIWPIKLGINAILMIRLRTYLVRRCCITKQVVSSDSNKTSLRRV